MGNNEVIDRFKLQISSWNGWISSKLEFGKIFTVSNVETT